MTPLITLRQVLRKSAAARKAAQAVDNPGMPVLGGMVRSIAGLTSLSPTPAVSNPTPGMSLATAAGAGAVGALGVAGIYALYRSLREKKHVVPPPSPGAG